MHFILRQKMLKIPFLLKVFLKRSEGGRKPTKRSVFNFFFKVKIRIRIAQLFFFLLELPSLVLHFYLTLDTYFKNQKAKIGVQS